MQYNNAKKGTLSSIVIGSLGNLVEYYDAFVYSAFALYFASSFFPQTDIVAQQLSAAVLFALAFLMRPIGGVVFGVIGDRFGRRKALLSSVLLMSFGSLLIAIVPTYSSIGLAAPVVLTIARILQGLSQGGEYGASATYLSEVSPPHQRGFYSGVWYMTLIGGQFVALLVLIVLQSLLTPQDLRDWGWRVPFAIGGALSLFALVMRRNLPETAHFEKVAQIAKYRNPLPIFLEHWKGCLLVIGLTVGGTSAVYTYTSYVQKFLKISVGLTDGQSTWVTAGGLIFAILLQPIYGAISDRVGRKPLLVFFGVAGSALTYPLLVALQSTKSAVIAFLLICSAWTIVTGYTAVAAVIKAELFPTGVRALGVGVPYALTVSIFGGTVDAVALSFKSAGHETWFFIYAAGCIFVSLLFYIFMKDTMQSSKLTEHD